VLAALAGCGGGGDARSRVREYVTSANAIQRGSTDEFKRANEAYKAFARGELRPGVAVTQLSRSEHDIRAARDKLADLRPPREAEALHVKLEQVYDMNIGLAHQTVLLAAYQRSSDKVLAPLGAENRRLTSALGNAAGPQDQSAALRRFASRLGGILNALRALAPPRVLRVPHADQVRRLEATRTLADRLRRALDAQDAQEVALLLKRFRQTASQRRPRRALARRAIAAYERRYQRLNDAYANVFRETSRLDKTLD
jgi:hypothetical protein